jgi:hypothetical protein
LPCKALPLKHGLHAQPEIVRTKSTFSEMLLGRLGKLVSGCHGRQWGIAPPNEAQEVLSSVS